MQNLFLLSVWGCSSSGNVTLKPDTASRVEASAEPTSEPTGEPTSEPGGEPSSQPDDEPTSEPTSEPVNTNKTWEGSREIDFPVNDYCTETQNESGFEITSESSSQVYLDACPDCNQMYRVDIDPSVICYETVEFGSQTIYGLDVQGEQADLYYFYQYSNGEIFSVKMAVATRSNDSWEYQFENIYDYFGTEYPYTSTGSFRLIE